MKPKLKDLQSFTKQYFPRKCPVVKWKKMKKYKGLAGTKKNIIYINPDHKRKDSFGCFVGEGLYKPKTKIKLKFVSLVNLEFFIFSTIETNLSNFF